MIVLYRRRAAQRSQAAREAPGAVGCREMSDYPMNIPYQQPDQRAREQQTLLAIVRSWHPSAVPEYRGFRCAFCQSPINAAWHHWLITEEYALPVHLCDEQCEVRFQAGTLPIGQPKHATRSNQSLDNAGLYPEEAVRRFREIVHSWTADREPLLHTFTCDVCGDELLMEPGPDGRPQRQGYHVWWQMEPEHRKVELHFHRACGQALGIASREEHPKGQSGQSSLNGFRLFTLPTGEQALIPEDVELQLPERSTLGPELLHFLLFIPWSDHLLSRIAAPYRDFFQVVLPYLHTRTTDVHIATCFPFVDELIQAAGAVVDERVVHLAFLLHDIGWSQLSEAEIAASLGVTGVTLNAQALGPKEKHALVGKDLAARLLASYPFDPQLTATQHDWICQAVLYHDKPWELAKRGKLPLEIKLVCDVDHLWSFTHENFWQDTVRKGVAPPTYLTNLEQDVATYFVTEQGKRKARDLLENRREEVARWLLAKAAQPTPPLSMT